MLNLSGINPVADNIISINGSVVGRLTDSDAQKVLDIIQGMMSGSGSISIPVQTPIQESRSTGSTERKPYVATKPFKASYKVDKLTSSDGKALFCICRNNGWTRNEKTAMNTAIKALAGITEIAVPFAGKDGKPHEFKAWGFKKKADAEAAMATLPVEFTPDQLNALNK